jgi:hypothetical protein
VLPAAAADTADTVARRIASKLHDLSALHVALGEAEPGRLPSDLLDDAGLRAVESKLGATLPEEYRALARHVGTSGAGPDHGLQGAGLPMPGFPLEGSGGVPPDPNRPFPLTKAWVALDDDGAPRLAGSGEAAQVHDGAMRLTELGDGCFTFLVLNGPHAGEVWEDLTDEGGPIQPVGALLSWYEAWLDELLVDGLVEAMRRAMPPGQTSPADETLQRWGKLLDERGREHDGAFDGRALAARALWKLYQGRSNEAAALIAKVEELPAEQAARLPEGMGEALTLWSYADDAAAALDRFPPAERLMSHRSWRIRRLLAHNPQTPGLALSWLAGDGRIEVRCAVASNRAATAVVLREALREATTLWRARADHLEALFVLDLLARHPNLPAEEMGQFARWAEAWPVHRTAPWVTRGVAFNPAAPAAMLAELARHPHPCVREAVARRRDLDSALLAGLAADADATVREAVAANPTTPVTSLAQLATDASERVRYQVAGRADLPAELQLRLAGDFATSVLLALGERFHLDHAAAELLALRPPVVLPGEDDDIAHDGPYEVTDDEVTGEHTPAHSSSGKSWTVPPLDLEIYPHSEARLPADEALFDRRPGAALVTVVTGRALAQPGYPAPLLAPLLAPLRAWLNSEDSGVTPIVPHVPGGLDDMVAYAAAAHPWLEKDAMRILLHSSYAPARARMASHPSVPAPIATLLLEDPSPLVQRKLALRTDRPLPTTLLEAWAVSEQVESRAAAASCPNSSAAVLGKLAKDAEAYVRRAVASNPGAGDELVAALAKDEDPNVRRAILWRPQVTAAVVALLAGDGDDDVRAWARWRQAREQALGRQR